MLLVHNDYKLLNLLYIIADYNVPKYPISSPIVFWADKGFRPGGVGLDHRSDWPCRRFESSTARLLFRDGPVLPNRIHQLARGITDRVQSLALTEPSRYCKTAERLSLPSVTIRRSSKRGVPPLPSRPSPLDESVGPCRRIAPARASHPLAALYGPIPAHCRWASRLHEQPASENPLRVRQPLLQYLQRICERNISGHSTYGAAAIKIDKCVVPSAQLPADQDRI